MPCLSPSSPIIPATKGGRQVLVEAMHEVVVVNRELSARPVAELHVVAVCRANIQDALLRFSHRGEICNVMDRTPLWAEATQRPSPGTKWYVDKCFNTSWEWRAKLEPSGEPGKLRWTSSEGLEAQDVCVWPEHVKVDLPPKYSPNRARALYSTFEIRFGRPGLQLFGFSFQTTHGIVETGRSTCQVCVEGPGTAAEWLMKTVTAGGGDLADSERLSLEKGIFSYWFAERCLSRDDAYSVAVLPHPRLRALPRWEIGSAYYPPPGKWLTVNVDGAPDDMAFADPHSDSEVIGLYPTNRNFELRIEHVLRPVPPSQTFRESVRTWETILSKGGI